MGDHPKDEGYPNTDLEERLQLLVRCFQPLVAFVSTVEEDSREFKCPHKKCQGACLLMVSKVFIRRKVFCKSPFQ